MDSVSEGIPDTEIKTFYENLPFHGVQSPEDKVVILLNFFVKIKSYITFEVKTSKLSVKNLNKKKCIQKKIYILGVIF